ncbi:hypothetical protein [Tabrizicola sp.]|nr:hypothetical protein [Tabrizicola sp.]
MPQSHLFWPRGANADPISDLLQLTYAGNTGGAEAIVTGTADITLQQDLM